MSESRCKTCRELILFVTMVNADGTVGRIMPLDSVPTSSGTIERKRNRAGKWFGRIVPADERNGRKLYVSHFATCDKPEAHRKKRETGRRRCSKCGQEGHNRLTCLEGWTPTA